MIDYSPEKVISLTLQDGRYYIVEPGTFKVGRESFLGYAVITVAQWDDPGGNHFAAYLGNVQAVQFVTPEPAAPKAAGHAE